MSRDQTPPDDVLDSLMKLTANCGARKVSAATGTLTIFDEESLTKFATVLIEVSLVKTGQDLERLDWLESNVLEEPLRPEAFGAEICPDTRLRYVLPPLVSWTSYSGPTSLRRAIDIARADGQGDGERPERASVVAGQGG